MTAEIFAYTMGYRLYLRGDHDAFLSAIASLQSALPVAHRTFINRGSVKYWHIERRAEHRLRAWAEQIKREGANVIWHEQQSEADVRARLIASVKRKQEVRRKPAA